MEIGQGLADTLVLPAAVINYTLSTKEDPSIVHPAHVLSAGSVIKYILDDTMMNHIQRFPFSFFTSRFIIVGHSAGAHIATFLVLNSSYLSLSSRDRIVGVVGVEGIYNIPGFDKKFGHLEMYREIVDMAFGESEFVCFGFLIVLVVEGWFSISSETSSANVPACLSYYPLYRRRACRRRASSRLP